MRDTARSNVDVQRTTADRRGVDYRSVVDYRPVAVRPRRLARNRPHAPLPPVAPQFDEDAGEFDAATDFLPLAQVDVSGQMEGGQVVRVELPRAALVSLGLPMSPERAGERVKADVLLGHDGRARAIRFVR